MRQLIHRAGSKNLVAKETGLFPSRVVNCTPRSPCLRKVVRDRGHVVSFTSAAETGSASQWAEVAERASNGLQPVEQQSLDAFTEQAVLDGASSLSDMTVEDPPAFEELGIDKLLVSCLAESGIELPSPIQESAIPQLLAGQNAAVQSYTGSGKTLAYLLPAMTLALKRAEAAYRRQRAAAAAGASALAEQDQYSVQVLVVAPSQELAMQICRVASSLLPPEGRSAVQQAIGGANMRRQAEALAEKQPLVVVGTPGRVADLIRTGALRVHRCPILIMDEADQLLGDVYAADMAHITAHCGKKLKPAKPAAAAEGGQKSSSSSSSDVSGDRCELLLPTKRQTVLVSATLWAGVLQRFARWCPKPLFLTMGNSPTWSLEDSKEQHGLAATDDAKTWGWGAKGWEGPASVVQQGPKTQGMVGGVEGAGLVPTLPPNLEHRYLVVNPRDKADAMRRAMYALEIGMGLGFMNWQQRLKDVAGKVAAKKIEVGQLHGDMTPLERAAVLDGARKGAFQLLLVSDVAARGIDLPQVDAVFNIELPSNAAHYAHRAGRTGRMGAPGTVLTLVAPGERFVVERLSKKLGVPILECHLSGGQLVVGPPVKKDVKKKPKVQHQQQQQPQQGRTALAEQQQPKAQGKASSSSSSSSASKQPALEALKSKEAAAADNDDYSDDDEDYVLDEDDDVVVEGDESLEAYQRRVKQELQAELEEIEREKQAARRHRYQQKQEAAAAAADSSSRQVQKKVRSRLTAGPKPKGTPAQAAAMAMAAIRADEQARRSKSKLPAAVLESLAAATGDASSKGSKAGQKVQRHNAGQQQQQQQRQQRRNTAGKSSNSGE